MDKFIKNFNKEAFVNVSFSDFKKTYEGKLKGRNITEVAKLLGIDTTEKEFKPKSEGKKTKEEK